MQKYKKSPTPSCQGRGIRFIRDLQETQQWPIKIQQILVLAVVSILLLTSVCHGEDRLLYGGLLKIRQEHRDSVFDSTSKTLKNEDFFRFSAELWGSCDITRNIKTFTKISYEPEYYTYSYKPENHDFIATEIIIENLYVELKDMFGLPVDMTAGRQDMEYGDGLLVSDGTPIDKERTSYFNAIKSTWKINQGHTIDLVYINDPVKDAFLPSVQLDNAGRQSLTQSDEQGVIVYSKNSIGNNMQLEPYYIFKREEEIPKNAKTASVPALDLHTIGTRAVLSYDSWKLRGEFASQFGDYQGGRTRTGYAGTLSATKVFAATLWKPQIETGIIYLSGDNSNSAGNEGWNPIFSRHTWLSNLYSNMYKIETGYTAYWTNLQLYRLTTKLSFPSDTSLSVSYNYLRANETTNVKGSAAQFLSNNGKERGHLVQTKLNQQFTKNVEGYLSLEYFFPGDFYRMRGNETIVTTRIIFRFGS